MAGMKAKEGCGTCCEPECEGIVADFSWECDGDEYTFTDESTPSTGATITAWSWQVYDAASCGGSVVDTSTDENPVFTITHPASVRLTITDSEGCSTSICQNLCDCATGGPNASFSVLQTDNDPCTFTFTDESTAGSCGGTIIAWEWKCGETVISTNQNPTNINMESVCGGDGPWDVTLTVTDDQCCQDSVVGNVNCLPVSAPCCNDSPLPSTITVTSSGWSDAGCSAANCSLFNGAHVCTWNGTAYRSADLGVGCSGSSVKWIEVRPCEGFSTTWVVMFFDTTFCFSRFEFEIDDEACQGVEHAADFVNFFLCGNCTIPGTVAVEFL